MNLDRFFVNVRRQEGSFYRSLYRLGKTLNSFDVPLPKSFYQKIFAAGQLAAGAQSFVARTFYTRPVLRALCESCGRNLEVDKNELPYISGHVRIIVGDNCRFNGGGAILANKIFEDPTIRIGDRTYVGYGPIINVAKSIEIGSDVLISDSCVISDNPGHPMDAEMRQRAEPVEPEQVKPVTLEDGVWLGARSLIMPGVTIGRGSVIGTGSVVTHDVPPGCLAAGNPARVIREL